MKWYNGVFPDEYETNTYKWMANKPIFKSKVNLGSVLIRMKHVPCKCCFPYPHGQFKGSACDEKWKIWPGKGIAFTIKTHLHKSHILEAPLRNP